jgi:ankyrin repeat protein
MLLCAKGTTLQRLRKNLRKVILDLNSQTFSLPHICAAYGSLDCLKFFLDRATPPSPPNNEGWTSLHSFCGHIAAAKELLNRGLS